MTLTETEIEAITASGIKRHVEPGDYLYRAGDVAYDFFVVIAGLVEIGREGDLPYVSSLRALLHPLRQVLATKSEAE